MRSLALLVFLVFQATGCASLSGEECLSMDWRAVGVEDGARGAPVSAASELVETCAKKSGAAPDMAAYLAGRQDGLKTYCTVESGFAVGARGEADGGVCVGDLASDFLAAYSKGKRLFGLEASVVRSAQAMSDARSVLWQMKQRIAEIETSIASTATPHEERIELVAELQTLKLAQRRTEASLETLAESKGRAEQELRTFRAALTAEPGISTGVVRPSNASF